MSNALPPVCPAIVIVEGEAFVANANVWANLKLWSSVLTTKYVSPSVRPVIGLANVSSTLPPEPPVIVIAVPPDAFELVVASLNVSASTLIAK